VTSGQRDRSPPSLSVLCGHPHRPNTIPGTASPSHALWGYEATRRRHGGCCTPYGLLSAAPSSQCTDNDSTEDFNTSPSKPLLRGHRACHDAPSEARFARTAVHSVVLCVIPSHVARTVRHACKLPPPWHIKGGAVPWPRKGRQRALTRTLSAFDMILALASINTSGTWRPSLLSRLACSPPSASTTVRHNIVPQARPCWTYGPGRNQDKTQCH
jgi:hypothetical protein